MKLTAKQAAERLNVSYVVASGLMTHLDEVGKAKIVEKIFHESGKGKPTRVYEVEQNVVINFGEDVATPAVVVAEATVDEAIAVCSDAGVLEPVVETVSEPEATPVAVEASGETVWDEEDEDDIADAA